MIYFDGSNNTKIEKNRIYEPNRGIRLSPFHADPRWVTGVIAAVVAGVLVLLWLVVRKVGLI